MKAGNQTTGPRIRLVLRPDVAIGPGKADLLEFIHETGSIAAAGRHLGMSYKRAWRLVEALNGHFKEPLISTSRGGSGRGGAALTPLGLDVLKRYRSIEKKTERIVEKEAEALKAHLAAGA